MFNITKGISLALFREFGKEYKIYKNEIKQNFTEPCFFLDHINSSLKQTMGTSYKYNNAFDICYFPRSKDTAEDISSVETRLFCTLEYINIDDNIVRGTTMNSQIIDEVLHFMVDYNFFIRKEQLPDETMQSLSVKGGIRI